jgi:hypothetical protein
MNNRCEWFDLIRAGTPADHGKVGYILLFWHLAVWATAGAWRIAAMLGQPRLNYSNVLRYRNTNMINV